LGFAGAAHLWDSLARRTLGFAGAAHLGIRWDGARWDS
jgi:hypothetical protein